MHKRRVAWTRRVAVFALALTFAMGCDDTETTGLSNEPLDPVLVATTIEDVVDQFFTTNGALLNMEVFGEAIGGGMFGGAPPAGGASFTLPPGMQGTWVYDGESGYYVLDGQRADEAPANGARIILYAVSGGEPVFPLAESGYMDLVDLSDPPTANLDVTVVVDGITYIDANVGGTFDVSGASLTFLGMFGDGTDVMPFAFAANESDIAFGVDFLLNFADFTADFELDGSGETGTATLTLANAVDTLIFDLDLTFNFLFGDIDITVLETSVITLNGVEIATVSGPIEEPVFTNGEGDPLTTAELAALESIFAAVGVVYEAYFAMHSFASMLLESNLVF